MKTLAVVNGLAKSGGGPSYGVPALCDALARINVGRFLLNIHAPEDGESFSPDPHLVKTISVERKNLGPFKIRRAPDFARITESICVKEKIEIIHNHGIWLPANHTTSQISRKLKIPMVSTTHGMLTEWSLNHHFLKKKLAWLIYQKKDLEISKVIHVTAESEADDLRHLGLRNPLAIIPNGTEIPEWRQEDASNNKNIKTALFISRIHPKKGLLNLVQAWSLIRPKGWRMLIVGPDENGHKALIQKAVHEKGLDNDFVFQEAVYNDSKWDIYHQADLFILPTYSENFGIVIPEALACGVPVITTQGTPWAELEEKKCGWWVPMGPQPLSQALHEAINLSNQDRKEMGLRGRRLVEEKYTWDSVAIKMKAVYEWILGGGKTPHFVRLKD